MAEFTPIPGPTPLPFIGNAPDVDPNNFGASINRLGDTYGRETLSVSGAPPVLCLSG